MRLTTEEVVRRYGKRCFAAAFSVCQNAADAEDVVQEVFIRYHTKPRAFDSEEHLKAWLLRVAINRARDVCKSFWHRHRVTWEETMAALPFEAPEDSALFAAVMALPDKYRVVIHLYYYEGYAVREIAALLSRRENTVKSQLRRARALLREQLKEAWNDDESDEPSDQSRMVQQNL
ncbi:Sigma-70 region 2 [Pseudoramibacter alactolyticus ATCC 23263]|jgi:RNA polymerase sigma-70 factor (ECF subfamily)|uniref:Sigma-70 region 2 n=1 Tax=Pseudoramibacter alactolyticus ATCC 23263 TaxID=887929 RepID=E6MHB3_9FIRM|nr:sigma-70 family RNA polymerase sigma factor [Pseudoramibacter alactolyticus]EFV02003.1 Sigma-70 region 2 [Pseudoramibacter alactolyticus ATCC 23263]